MPLAMFINMMIIYNNSTLARLVRCCLCALRWCLHSITREVQEAVFSPVFPVFILVFCSRSYIFPCLSCISFCILVQKLYVSLSFLYFFLYFGPEVVSILVFPVFLLVFLVSGYLQKVFTRFSPQESSSIKNTKILINVPKFSSSSCFLSPQ